MFKLRSKFGKVLLKYPNITFKMKEYLNMYLDRPKESITGPTSMITFQGMPQDKILLVRYPLIGNVMIYKPYESKTKF